MAKNISTPKVVVVTRTKDRAVLLERAVASAQAQSMKDFVQVIINDGGDNAPVEAIIQKYNKATAGRILLINNAKHTEKTKVLNQAIRSIQSTYVAILDDDDTWDPSYLEKMTNYLDETSAKGVVAVIDRVIEKIDGSTITFVSKNRWRPDITAVSLYGQCLDNYAPTVAFVYRRDVFDELNGYDETLDVAEDWEFTLRFLLRHDIDFLQTEEALAFYHHRPEVAGDAGNSVFAGVDRHRRNLNKLANRYLRDEIKTGKFGIGYIMNSLRYERDTFGLTREAQTMRLEDHLNRVAAQLEESLKLYVGNLHLSRLAYRKLKTLLRKDHVSCMAKVPHIQIDAFPLVDDHFSGVGHYTLGIVRGFDELASEGKLTYSLISPRFLADRLLKYDLHHYKKIIRNPIPNRVIRGFMKYHWPFPCDLFLGRGYYYFPSFLAWPRWFTRASVVVHDVTYLAVPECVDKGNRDYLARTVPFSLKNADNIVANSHFTKSEIVKYYHYDPAKISVAHASIDRRLFYRRSAEEIHKVRVKYDIYSEHYILTVGNIEPRKNYIRLVDAYTSLPKAFTDKYPLVIVGAGGWNNQDIKDRIQAAKERGYHIINPKQFVEDKDMPALYSGAKLYIFTPIYEGFGMSPLEAYACGTPVVASNIASVPEAAGKAAVYVDPYDTAEIARVIKDTVQLLDKDPDHFAAAMEKHLTSLNWRTSAEITAAALTGLPVARFQSREDNK